MADQETLTEIVGYLASASVLISMLMKDMRILRIINSIGCALFVTYGILLHYSWPVIITNAVIIFINGYYLLKTKEQK